jgi:hypothetical protein
MAFNRNIAFILSRQNVDLMNVNCDVCDNQNLSNG